MDVGRYGRNVTRAGSGYLAEPSSRRLGLSTDCSSLLVGGAAAGVMGGWLGQGWIWGAMVVLVAIFVLMYGFASATTVCFPWPSGCAGTRPKDAPGPTPVPARGARRTP